MEDMPNGWLNFIDLESAIEMYTPMYQLLLTDSDFWRACNSLQLDETIALYATTLIGDHRFLGLVNNRHPIGFGMPEKASAFFADSLAFRLLPTPEQNESVVNYAEGDVLQSGWMIGEKRIRGATAVADVSFGKGRVILLGFPVQSRAQTWGTFKLLLNSLYYAAAEKVD